MLTEEDKLREQIEDFTPNELAYFTELPIDFYREFRDRINFAKLYDILERRLCTGCFNSEWYTDEKRRQQIQKEFLFWYLEREEKCC